MSEEKIDSKNFDDVINGKKPVLVDFFATWCGPCQMMLPIVEEVSKEAKGFKVIKIDIDELPEIAAKYNVMSVPTFVVFKAGKEVERMMGVMPKEVLVEKVKDLINK